MNNNCGYYQVGTKQFTSKNSAIYESLESRMPIYWNFYNDVFQNFSNTKLNTLGQTSIDSMYKQRAQQLRDNYDYLILNYSGGADSHNILMTFLNNNIKLDEIHVKYSESVDRKIYTPDITNKNSENIFSEFDYTIKPVLDEVSKRFPNIKIDIHDLFTKKHKIIDESFVHAGHWNGAFELLRCQSFSDSIINMPNKKIADIFGVDKPIVVYKDNTLFLLFNDITVDVATGGNRHEQYSNVQTELFYWTKDMPELVFEQAYQIYLYFKTNPTQLKLIDYNNIDLHNSDRLEALRKLKIDLIYTNWDHNKFQVGKSNTFSTQGRERDKYYTNHVEFKSFLDVYESTKNNWLKTIKDTNTKIFFSPWYRIGHI